MKKLLSLVLFSAVAQMVFGQNISENTMAMAYGSQNAIVAEIRDGDAKFVEKEWKDFIKTYGKLKKVKKSNEWVVENIRVSDIKGTEGFNLYSKVSPLSTTSQLVVWVEFGAEGYLSSEEHPEAYAGLEELLREFDYTVRKDRAGLEVEEQEKVLAKNVSDLDKLKKENDKLHDAIEKAKATIAKAEQDIINNEANQEEAVRVIEAQEETVEKVKEKYNNMKKDGK